MRQEIQLAIYLAGIYLFKKNCVAISKGKISIMLVNKTNVMNSVH